MTQLYSGNGERPSAQCMVIFGELSAWVCVDAQWDQIAKIRQKLEYKKVVKLTDHV